MAKRITLYGIFTCLALIFGYIESLFSLSFIAPGIKLGLANCICLLLIASGDIRGALLVNITRVTLSALLFSTPFALLFSLSAGIISTLAAFALSRFKAVTAVGYGIGGAAVHNIVQITVAALIFGGGVVYYLPFMLIASLFCGGLTGGTALYLSRRNIPNIGSVLNKFSRFGGVFLGKGGNAVFLFAAVVYQKRHGCR